MSSYGKHKRVLQIFLEVKQQFTLHPMHICHNCLMDMTSFPTLPKLCKESGVSWNSLQSFIILVSTCETCCEGLHHAGHLLKSEFKNGPCKMSLQSERSMKLNTWVQIGDVIMTEACLLGMSAKK